MHTQAFAMHALTNTEEHREEEITRANVRKSGWEGLGGGLGGEEGGREGETGGEERWGGRENQKEG